MAEEALALIKKAEADAVKIVADATLLAEEMIDKAKKDTAEKEAALRNELQKEMEKAKNAALQLAEEKAKAIVEAGISESRQISVQAIEKISEVYKAVLDKITE